MGVEQAQSTCRTWFKLILTSCAMVNRCILMAPRTACLMLRGIWDVNAMAEL